MSKKKKVERPGVMIYFDSIKPFYLLSFEEVGILFMTAMTYSQYGVLPDFNDNKALQFAWETWKPKLDYSSRSYLEKVQRNTYASYCNKAKNGKVKAMDWDEWCEAYNIDTGEWCQMESSGTNGNQTVSDDALGYQDRNITRERNQNINKTKEETKNIVTEGKGEIQEEGKRPSTFNPIPSQTDYDMLARKNRERALLHGW